MVARDGPIRAANQDRVAARRVRIGPGRPESMERWLRQLALRASVGGGFSIKGVRFIFSQRCTAQSRKYTAHYS
jgi:hypothetical protein